MAASETGLTHEMPLLTLFVILELRPDEYTAIQLEGVQGVSRA